MDAVASGGRRDPGKVETGFPIRITPKQNHRTKTPAADGEIVWSWRRDRGVKLAGGSRRRRWQETPLTGESTYKP
jgi:hypothetical protein